MVSNRVAEGRPAEAGAAPAEPGETPRSLTIASGGLSTSRQVRNYLFALAADVIAKRVPPRDSNASVNAIGKGLKVVEMEHRYGKAAGGGEMVLALADAGPVSEMNPREAEIIALRVRLEELENPRNGPPPTG
jgi:hypothetical protein